MVVNDTHNLIFIHIPKTAGLSVTNALGGQTKEYRTHGPCSLLGPQYKGYTKFAVIRNPFDWYLSSYYFKLSGDKGFDKLGNFNDFLEDMLFLTERTKRWFKPWPRIDPAAIIEPCLQAGRQDLGFLTLNLLYYGFADYEAIIHGTQDLPRLAVDSDACLLDEILRLESLAEDFSKMVKSRHMTFPPDLLKTAPRKNITPGKQGEETYNEEMRSMVERQDAPILKVYYP